MLHSRLRTIYLSNLLLSFHYFLILYINSSYLGSYFSPSRLALLYIVGSAINLIIFLHLPRILDQLGNYKFTLWSIILEGVAIAGLIIGGTSLVVGAAFILHQIVISMIWFGLDVFLEGATENEGRTGIIRGMFLTLSNIILVFSPLVVGSLLTDHNFWTVYLVSLAFLIPLFLIIYSHLRSAAYKSPIRHAPLKILRVLSEFRFNKDVRGILQAQLCLQFFYTWMVIYMPIYLHEHIGFSWQQIGIIFTIMLLPFMLFELPVGTLADKKLGEKEILIVGFIIMAVATFCIPLLHSAFATTSILAWSAVLFFTRVGASFVEITSESYFFKHVNEQNTTLISLFRMTKPIAYIIAPLVVTGVIYMLEFEHAPFGYMFSILGMLMLFGVKCAVGLKDTR